MRKYWYIYRHNSNIAMTASKHLVFYILENEAKRKWSKVTDTATDDLIKLGEYEARLEPLK